MTRLLSALQGRLREDMQAEGRAVGGAVQTSVTASARRLQDRIRQHVDRILPPRRGGRRVSGAIRHKIYPNQSPGLTAAQVYSRLGRHGGRQFQDFLVPHFFGATLRPTGGNQFIAIAAPGVGRVSNSFRGRSRLAQALDALRAGSDPRIRRIPLPGGRFIIVRDPALTKRGAVRKGGRSEVLGWLVRRVVVRAKGGVDPIVREETDRFARDLVRNMDRA